MSKLTLEKLEEIGPFAWPGGYANTFVDKDGCVLCFDCAKKAVAEGEAVSYGGYIGQEDESGFETCEECSQLVDPALRHAA